MAQGAPLTAGQLHFTDHTSWKQDGETWQCQKVRSRDESDGTERDNHVLSGG